MSSKYIIAFLELAKSHNVNLVLGSIILKSETGDKNTNSALIINRKGEIIFLPSSFRKATGSIAWDVLTKARAIENQIYFCACNQTGGIGNKERCGNSRIISFDGKIISEIGEEESIITANLDMNELRKFRKEFPVLKQIRQF